MSKAPTVQALRPPVGRLKERLAAGDRPYVTLKAAISLDGRIATRTGESRWITGEAARAHAMRLRAGHDAVLVGLGTVQADDPRLNVRLPDGSPAPGRQPARIVVDSQFRIDPRARLLAADGARRIVITGNRVQARNENEVMKLGVEAMGCATPRPEPEDFLPWLRTLGIRTILVEGGARMHASIIAQGCADALFLYIAGRVIGDPEAPGWCGPLGHQLLAEAPRVKLRPPLTIGDDVLVQGWFEPAPPPDGPRGKATRAR